VSEKLFDWIIENIKSLMLKHGNYVLLDTFETPESTEEFIAEHRN